MDKALLEHYAYALFSLSKDENKEDAYLKEREWLDEVFSKNPDLLSFLSSPEFTSDEKEEVRKKVLDPDLSKAVSGFVRIRLKRKALKEFHPIFLAYRHLYNEDNGVLEGVIYTAFTLDESQRRKLEESFSGKYGKKVSFRQYLDKNLIGGRKVYIGDTLYDNSIDSRLESVRQSLLKQKA